MLARLTVYVVVLRLLLLGWQQFWLWRDATYKNQVVGGVGAILTFAAVLMITALVLRWVRQSLMWRLRNRLIVTYMFVGVIPVMLVVTLALIAGYLFSNQYASSQIRSAIDTELTSLSLVNRAMLAQIEGSAKPALPAAPATVRQNFPGLRTSIYRDGKRLGEGEGETLPPWVDKNFTGLVLEKNEPVLKAVEFSGDKRLAAVSTVPLSKEILERTARGLGEIRVHLSQRRLKNERNSFVITPRRKKNAGETAEPENVDYTPSSNAWRVAGSVPPHSARWFDPDFRAASLSPDIEWDSGEQRPISFVLRTRPSALTDRLFSHMGELAPVILGTMVGIGIFFALIELVAVFISIGLTRTITSSVYNLYQATQQINRGNLKYRIPVKSKDQLAALQTAFNSMAANLENLIREQKEKERLEGELAIAQEVQATLFPRESAEVPGLELHGVCRPARTVSGDYFDFVPVGENQLGIAVGDISGKGISAALLMATIHSAVRAYDFGRKMYTAAEFNAAEQSAGGGTAVMAPSEQLHSPAQVMTQLNRHLYRTTPAEKYATLFLGLYDGENRSLTYCNAGHLPPIIVGHDGVVRSLEGGGIVIGLFDDMDFADHKDHLRPGDIFVAFSDGITEPENEFGEFGEERLIEIIRANRHLPLARISEMVTGAVNDWIGDNEQPDDVTLVLARVR